MKFLKFIQDPIKVHSGYLVVTYHQLKHFKNLVTSFVSWSLFKLKLLANYLISCLRFTYILASIVLHSATNQNRATEILLAMNRGHEHGYKREERQHSSNIGSTGVGQLFIISAEKYIWISISLNWVS